tara:strand:- start:17424 stop:18077 length:654 start_codon:yes stop_codon:yes gene_type:complete
MNYNKIYNDVEKKMSNNKVFYHTIEHINNMLLSCNELIKTEKEFQVLKNKEINLENTNINIRIFVPERLFFAILFHDIIYDVKNKYNELDSANYFKSYIQKNKIDLSEKDIFVISELIYSTKNHKEINNSKDYICLESMFLIDLDLESLSYDFNTFKKNNENIKKEYEIFYTKKQVEKGRINFLKKMLKKDNIYLTNYFKRKNIIVKENIKKILLEN